MARSGSPDAFLERIRAFMESNEKRQLLLSDAECLNGMCILLDNPQYTATLLSVFMQLADTALDENANYGAHELSKLESLRAKVRALRDNTQQTVADKAMQLHSRLAQADASVSRAAQRFDLQPHLAMRVNSPDVFAPFSTNKTHTAEESAGSGRQSKTPFIKKPESDADKNTTGMLNSPSVKFISVASASTRSIVLQLIDENGVDSTNPGDLDRSMVSAGSEVERAKQAILRVRGVVSIQTDSRKRRLTVRLSRALHVARLASSIRVQTGLDVAQVLRAANGIDEELVPFDRLGTAGGTDDPRYLDDSELFDAGGAEGGRTAMEEYGSVIKETTAVWLGKAVSFLSNAFW